MASSWLQHSQNQPTSMAQEEQEQHGMMIPPEKDETDAVISLLQFSEKISREKEDKSRYMMSSSSSRTTQPDVETEDAEREGNNKGTHDPMILEAGVQQNEQLHQDVPSLSSSNPKSSHEGGTLQSDEPWMIKVIGKKRKDHPTSLGQFEDAPEVMPVIIPAPTSGILPPQPFVFNPNPFSFFGQSGGSGGSHTGPHLPSPHRPYNSGFPYHSYSLHTQHQQHALGSGNGAGSNNVPSTSSLLDTTQLQLLDHQAQRRHHLETMLRSHLALQQLPPLPPIMLSPQLIAAQNHAAQLASSQFHSSQNHPSPHHHPPLRSIPSMLYPRTHHLPTNDMSSSAFYSSLYGEDDGGGAERGDYPPVQFKAAFRVGNGEWEGYEGEEDKDEENSTLSDSSPTSAQKKNVLHVDRKAIQTQAMIPPVKPTPTASQTAAAAAATVTANPMTAKAIGEGEGSIDDKQGGQGSKEAMPAALPNTVTTTTAAAAAASAAITSTTPKPDDSPSLDGANSSGNPRRFFSTKMRYEEYIPPPGWSELAEVPKMEEIPPDDDMKRPIAANEIHASDVLLGRGGQTNSNPGNIKFRDLVSKYRMAYCTAPKGDKGALARYLCNYVRSKGGRFLRKEESNGNWYEVGDEKAVMKCGQALREGTAALIRKAVAGGSSGGGGGGASSDDASTDEQAAALEVQKRHQQYHDGIYV